MLSHESPLLPSTKGMEMKNERATLPQEVIEEILKRLPVKSLLRFRSVCRLWNILIKSPSFISSHLHYSAHNNPFLLLKGGHDNSQLLLSLDDPNMKINVEMPFWEPLNDPTNYVVNLFASCNGLLFVEEKYVGGIDDDHEFYYMDSYFLWNPATKEVWGIPDDPITFSSISLIFGFGFSHVLNDYKIVGLYKSSWIQHDGIHVKENYSCVAFVYSLRRGSWKKVETEVLNGVRLLTYCPAVIFNETMFWLGVVMDEHEFRHMVVSFDMAMEVFSLIPIPSSSCTPRLDFDSKLSVYENKLAMLWRPHKIGDADDSSFIDFWVMEESNGTVSGKSWSWTKKFSICTISDGLYPICVLKNGIVCINKTCGHREIPNWLSESDQDLLKNQPICCLSSFNLTTEEWTTSHSSTNRVCHEKFFFNYAESLVSLRDHIHVNEEF